MIMKFYKKNLFIEYYLGEKQRKYKIITGIKETRRSLT